MVRKHVHTCSSFVEEPTEVKPAVSTEKVAMSEEVLDELQELRLSVQKKSGMVKFFFADASEIIERYEKQLEDMNKQISKLQFDVSVIVVCIDFVQIVSSSDDKSTRSSAYSTLMSTYSSLFAEFTTLQQKVTSLDDDKNAQIAMWKSDKGICVELYSS